MMTRQSGFLRTLSLQKVSGVVHCVLLPHYLFRVYAAPLSMEREPPLPLLMKKVAAAIPNKWMEVGIQLYIPKPDLDVLHPRPHCFVDNHRAFSVRYLNCGGD